MNRVHPDLLGGQGLSEVVDVVCDNLFSERIARTARSAGHPAGVRRRRHERGHRSRHDDRRAGMQVLHAGVYEVEDTDEVHIDRVDKRLRWKARGQRTDAGIGHHDVEAAELGDAAIDRGRQRRAVTDIGDLGERALALLLDQPGRLVEVLGSRERIPLVSMSSQMSTAMMSAPSAASIRACDRP